MGCKLHALLSTASGRLVAHGAHSQSAAKCSAKGRRNTQQAGQVSASKQTTNSTGILLDSTRLLCSLHTLPTLSTHSLARSLSPCQATHSDSTLDDPREPERRQLCAPIELFKSDSLGLLAIANPQTVCTVEHGSHCSHCTHSLRATSFQRATDKLLSPTRD